MAVTKVTCLLVKLARCVALAHAAALWARDGGELANRLCALDMNERLLSEGGSSSLKHTVVLSTQVVQNDGLPDLRLPLVSHTES